jgi:hypothetical protein
LQNYDEKNIRRRVYDALNVLMAMDIIIKDKKEIHWRGLPSTTVGDMGMLKVRLDSFLFPSSYVSRSDMPTSLGHSLSYSS